MKTWRTGQVCAGREENGQMTGQGGEGGAVGSVRVARHPEVTLRARWSSLGLRQQDCGLQPSIQELVNSGTVPGARDQVLVVGRHITT